MKSFILFGMVLAVLAPTAISIQCLTGHDITASAAVTFPVGNFSTMMNCSAGNDACVRATATGHMLGFSVSGIGYLCAARANCTLLATQCSTIAQNL
uniref:UPAR/Ly6 domain-containing protein n=1 Tax=Ciona savignyi TaxID=51511 RepID=H2YGW4_CIOSA